jgi:CubicO group peptidase (beta-lactamase class C family)
MDYRKAKHAACVVALLLSATIGPARAQPDGIDAGLLNRIDTFVAREASASGLPGVAIVVLQQGHAPHVRGFGDDGRGKPITGDTPFPIGSLTKSFTALLVRQAAEAGELDVDAPVRRWLPWFRVADEAASARITLRHLLNHTSGFSRADGLAPLLAGSRASIDELARGLATVSLNRPVGERFEYSNLNYVVLAAVLQAAPGPAPGRSEAGPAPSGGSERSERGGVQRRSWRELMRERVLEPLAMTHSHVDHQAARRDGMTAVHQIVFGVPRAQDAPELLPAFEPTGGLVASANDMARWLRMLLAQGVAADPSSRRVLSAAGVAQLLAPASPPGHSTLLSADFDFRYGEGWFVGPFGVAADARWHLGSLMPFAAWMVLLPDTKQAVAVLINANTELPIGNVNALMSRLPIGVVNLLRGQPVPQGPSLRAAYGRFIAVACVVLALVAMLAWLAGRARRAWGSVALAFAAASLFAGSIAAGIGPSLLRLFAPELAIVLALVVALLVAPLAWRAITRRGRA